MFRVWKNMADDVRGFCEKRSMSPALPFHLSGIEKRVLTLRQNSFPTYKGSIIKKKEF